MQGIAEARESSANVNEHGGQYSSVASLSIKFRSGECFLREAIGPVVGNDAV